MGDYIPTEPLVEEQAAAIAPSFKRDVWILMGLAVQITFLRTYSRWRMGGWRNFQADDVLVWLALGLYVSLNLMDVQLIDRYRGLANDFATPELRASIDPLGEEYRIRVAASKLRFTEWPLYALLLWTLKAAMAIFYMRLTESLEGYRRRIWVFFGLIVTTFAVIIIVPFAVCRPITRMWQILPDPGPVCYPESAPEILWTVLACIFVTDAYLLWLPIPMLFRASLPRTTKLSLGCLFGCGLFVTVAATLRITRMATVAHDFQAIGFWSNRETFVSILTTNLPAIFVLMKRWFNKLFSAESCERRRKFSRTTIDSSKQTYATARARVKGMLAVRSPPPPDRAVEHSSVFQTPQSGKSGNYVPLSHMEYSRPRSWRPQTQRSNETHSFVMRGESALSTTSILIHGMPRPRSPIPSVQESLWNSRRRSLDSVEGDLLSPTSPRPRRPSNTFAPLARRGSNLSRRGSNTTRPGTAGTGGIRMQADIMVVAEALHELGARPRLDMADPEYAASKPLPRPPKAVKDKKPLPGLPDTIYRWR